MSTLAPLRQLAAGRPSRRGTRLPWVFVAVTIAAEIAYPLVAAGTTRDRLTVATVAAFFVASVSHAALTRGWGVALWLVVATAGGGFAAELVGVRTGWPFGHYSYASTLGPEVAGVPVAVPLAWTMMAWPALLAAQRLTPRRRALTPLVAAWALASWDVFLDPQMVAAGHWSWSGVGTTLPGVPGVPLQNFAAWLGVAVVLMALLAPAVARHPATDAPAYTLVLWTFASSVLANAAFWGRPGVALAGGLAMGVVTVPLAGSLWRG